MCLSRSDSVLLCSHVDTQGPKLTLSFKMGFGEKIKRTADSNCTTTLGLVYKKLNSQNANVTNSNVNDSVQ